MSVLHISVDDEVYDLLKKAASSPYNKQTAEDIAAEVLKEALAPDSRECGWVRHRAETAQQ